MGKIKDPSVVFGRSVIERFISKIEIGDNGCIEWTDKLNVDGYGQISVGNRKTQVKILAHRWALQFALGGVLLSDEVKACHHCDNPSCVNPLHLFSGNHQDNMTDMVTKERQAVSFGNAKLDWDKVDSVRNSNLTGSELSNQLNISKATISEIRNNVIWKEETRIKAIVPK